MDDLDKTNLLEDTYTSSASTTAASRMQLISLIDKLRRTSYHTCLIDSGMCVRLTQVGSSFSLFNEIHPLIVMATVSCWFGHLLSCFLVVTFRPSPHDASSLRQELGGSNRPHRSDRHSDPEAAISTGGGHVLRRQGQRSCSGNRVRGDRPVAKAAWEHLKRSVAGLSRARPAFTMGCDCFFSGDPAPSRKKSKTST